MYVYILYIHKASEKKRNICNLKKFCVFFINIYFNAHIQNFVFLFINIYIYIYIYIYI